MPPGSPYESIFHQRSVLYGAKALDYVLISLSSSDQLNRHNVLEHDASLSRMDAYYGSNHLFNPSVFASSKAFWTSPVLSAQMLANSKLARQIDSRAYNPTYTFTSMMEQFSLGELAAPIIAFGNLTEGTADRALVEYFFGT